MLFTGLVALALLLCPIAFSKRRMQTARGFRRRSINLPPLKQQPPAPNLTAAELRKLLNHAGEPGGRHLCCSHAQSEE